MNRRSFTPFAVALAVATTMPSFARAALNGIDSITQLADPGQTLNGGSQLTGLAYKPAAGDQPGVLYALSRGGIVQISDPGTASAATAVSINFTPWQLWQQDIVLNGTTNLAGGQPIVRGLALNPVQVGSAAPYSLGIISDIPTAVTKSGVTQSASNQKRLYSYNLNIATPSPSDQYAGYSVFSPVMTAAQHYAAAGVATVPNVSISQPVYSYDGQSVYFVDGSTTSTAMKGVYRTNVLTGTTTKILSDTARSLSDLSVAPISAGVDRIYLGGESAVANSEGLSYVDVTTATGSVGAVTTLLTQQQIREFVGGTGADVYSITGTAVDGGDVYFNVFKNSTNARGALLRLDAEGRLSKVMSYAERRAAAGTNAGTSPTDFTIRDAVYSDGVNPARTVKQMIYAEGGGQVATVWLFETGDFNRDGFVTTADATLFKTALGLRDSTTADITKFKYDLNAATLISTSTSVAPTVGIDYADVKVFQQFLGFSDGDADMNLALDIADVNAVYASYNTSGRLWTQGEFTGDLAGLVDFDDLLVLARGLVLLPNVPQISTTQYSQLFVDDYYRALGIAVPEPTTLAALAGAGVIALRRRRSVG